MCYACLSTLDDVIDENTIKKLKCYFLGLTPNNRDLITVSKIANALEVSNEKAVEIILKCEKEKILKRHFGIRCPECGALIKEIPEPDVKNIRIDECYCCDEKINITDGDIVILFELLKNEIPFESGQQSKQNIHNTVSIVAQEDTLRAFQEFSALICDEINRKRLKEDESGIIDQKKKETHAKAVKKANRNRRINIILNIFSICIMVIIIDLAYRKYGFGKITVFLSFGIFAVQFVGNYIFKEFFLTDVKRIEDEMDTMKKND